jgi:hypothetical protein
MLLGLWQYAIYLVGIKEVVSGSLRVFSGSPAIWSATELFVSFIL